MEGKEDRREEWREDGRQNEDGRKEGTEKTEDRRMRGSVAQKVCISYCGYATGDSDRKVATELPVSIFLGCEIFDVGGEYAGRKLL